MCRYSHNRYRSSYACFKCRKSFNLGPIGFGTKDISFSRKCPDCGNEMLHMGRDFKAPRRNKLSQWKKIALLAAHGILFRSCGCDGPGYRPKTYSEAKSWVKKAQL